MQKRTKEIFPETSLVRFPRLVLSASALAKVPSKILRDLFLRRNLFRIGDLFFHLFDSRRHPPVEIGDLLG